MFWINDIFSCWQIFVTTKYPSSECSAQEQVIHCKRRNQAYSSAEGRSSTANTGTKAAVLPGMIWCGSFPLLSAPHTLFSIWTDFKRWRWGDWIWLPGPSGLRRNSPQGLNISSIRIFDQIRDPENPITLRIHNKVSSSWVFCPRVDLPLQIQTQGMQFYPKACLPPQTQEPRLQFY